MWTRQFYPETVRYCTTCAVNVLVDNSTTLLCIFDPYTDALMTMHSTFDVCMFVINAAIYTVIYVRICQRYKQNIEKDDCINKRKNECITLEIKSQNGCVTNINQLIINSRTSFRNNKQWYISGTVNEHLVKYSSKAIQQFTIGRNSFHNMRFHYCIHTKYNCLW